MKILLLGLVCVLAAGCTHLNYYNGPDAALVPVPCDNGPATATDGQRYLRFIQILEVDGSFVGSGQGCKDRFVYHIAPGVRRLKVMSNYVDETATVERVAMLVISLEFKPHHEYKLNATYDGQVMAVSFMDAATGETVAEAKTAEIAKHGLSNGAVSALPLIIRGK